MFARVSRHQASLTRHVVARMLRIANVARHS
jgi:hypothetical protein